MYRVEYVGGNPQITFAFSFAKSQLNYGKHKRLFISTKARLNVK
jgi:hypothetical protein